MSAGRYIAGLALLAVTVVPLVAGAVALRRRTLPGWSGPPARLAEAVAALSTLVVAAELLGAVGALRRGWLATACVLIGVLTVVLAKRRTPNRRSPLPVPPRLGSAAKLVAFLTVALVAFEWSAHSVEVLGRGMADPDTLWYHMPFAAHFANDGWTTRLIYTQSEPITTFHPASAELIHGIGISLFGGYDVLSPFVNLAFGGLALLAGWCAGRRFGVAPASMAGVAVVLSAPIILQTQPGEAANDAAGLAWLIAAAALLLTEERPRGAAIAFAGAAAGMALGTKLSFLAPAGLLTIGMAYALRRVRPWLAWVLPLIACGGFWYARNLLRTGNPLPWYHVALGPLDLPSPPLPQTNAYSFSVAHYLTDVHVLRHDFVPGLDDSIGHLWPVVVLLAAAGGALLLVRGRDRIERMLGAVALCAGIAYVITPASAGGPDGAPILFALNLRFAAPPLALGLALLPIALRRRAGVTLAALFALLIATQWSASFRPPAATAWGLVLAAGLFAAALVIRRGGRRPALALAAVALAAAIALWPAQRNYLRDRYAASGPTLPPISTWAQRLHGDRIGIVGYLLQYPLYGRDTSNEVDWVGQRGPHGGFGPIRSCGAWRAALAAGRYRYVVTAPSGSVVLAAPGRPPADPPEAAWTRSAPGAVEVLRAQAERATVFRLDRPPTAAGCGGGSATVSRRG